MPCFFDLRGMSILPMGPSHPVTLQLGLLFMELIRNVGVKQSSLMMSRLVLFFSGVSNSGDQKKVWMFKCRRFLRGTSYSLWFKDLIDNLSSDHLLFTYYVI